MKHLNSTDRKSTYPNVMVQFIKNHLEYFHGKSILDFGAGKKMIFTHELRGLGLNVQACDCGENQTDEHVKITPNYEIIIASNVVNVQSSKGELRGLFQLIKENLNGGVFYFNYPSKPRKANLSVQEILEVACEYFGLIKRMKGKGPIFKCKG